MTRIATWERWETCYHWQPSIGEVRPAIPVEVRDGHRSGDDARIWPRQCGKKQRPRAANPGARRLTLAAREHRAEQRRAAEHHCRVFHTRILLDSYVPTTTNRGSRG